MVKYNPQVMRGEMVKRFTHHPPIEDQIDRYVTIRAAGLDLVNLLMDNCPGSREQMIAIERIEEAVMWANAAIARRE